MLKQLLIRDFAIVEVLELEILSGMTAVTGETGAGKSILVDAIGLLLGDRANSSTIRQGAERTDISAVFDLTKLPDACDWLAEHSLSLGKECYLRRVITSNGRSRNYINRVLQPTHALREFGAMLVDIHGQNEHQSLLHRSRQMQLLDDYAVNQEILNELSICFKRCNCLKGELHNLRKADIERDSLIEILRYHLRELVALDLSDREIEKLESERQRLSDASHLIETSKRLLINLTESDGDAITDRLNKILHDLSHLTRLDARLGTIDELLRTALLQILEAGRELRGYAYNLDDLDPSHLARVEQRLTAVYQLARKHRVTVDELPALRARFEMELNTLENSEARLESLQKSLKEALDAYQIRASKLRERRAVAARELDDRISIALAGLGMPGGRFAIFLQSLDKITPYGSETVEFNVSANLGQQLQPLSKIASGGEISRISLAIQVTAAHATRIPTLIFDEVDTGIGGNVAEMIGLQLRKLGENRQVLCVTHLPQVATQAHHQFKVEKQTDGNDIYIQIKKLTSEERVTEIARMLGGLEMTASSLAHAREMLDKASDLTHHTNTLQKLSLTDT